MADLTGTIQNLQEFTNGKKYNTIYADPPWQYRVYSKKGLGRSAESHYPTMGIDEIRALPVAELAEKDCALFLSFQIPLPLLCGSTTCDSSKNTTCGTNNTANDTSNHSSKVKIFAAMIIYYLCRTYLSFDCYEG